MRNGLLALGLEIEHLRFRDDQDLVAMLHPELRNTARKTVTGYAVHALIDPLVSAGFDWLGTA